MANQDLLKEIEDQLNNIVELPLKETSKNLVFGKGSPSAKIMFIGESPGNNEDIQGIPFVGAAGKNLDKLLNSVGLSLDSVYVANILKYRPPENRNPLPDEIKLHTPWLLKQIQIIKPSVICSLGNYATKFFLAKGEVDKMDKQPGITSLHGKVKEMDFFGLKIKLIPLFHPAAIIYNQKLKPLWEEDMEIVKREVSQKSLF
jgi:uracil-DNA glycosylase